MQKADFKIKVIADVTCDIDGSIPSTLRPSTIQNPFYDFNTETQEIVAAFSNENHISVMAVDNLPCELPRDASFDFGTQIMQSVLPSLFGKENKGILDRATIAHNGSLTNPFLYLQEYIDKVPLSVQV
jgi:alanine dehydrogenase